MSLNQCKELGPGFYPNDWTHTGEKPNRRVKHFSTLIILERNHIVESKLGIHFKFVSDSPEFKHR